MTAHIIQRSRDRVVVRGSCVVSVLWCQNNFGDSFCSIKCERKIRKSEKNLLASNSSALPRTSCDCVVWTGGGGQICGDFVRQTPNLNISSHVANGSCACLCACLRVCSRESALCTRGKSIRTTDDDDGDGGSGSLAVSSRTPF